MRYVIYATETGIIRAVMRGSLAGAQLNVGAGEALLQFYGYVSAATHLIVDGVVTPK